MKSILGTALETRVKVGRFTFTVRPTVARVRLAIETLADDALLPDDRLKLATWYLYRFPRPRPSQEAIDAVWNLLEEEPPYVPDPNTPQGLSIEQDAALIVAAFRQLYGIDLNREADRIDFRTFEALLSGITDETRLGEIMSIRTMKLPRRTPTNGEYIRDLQRLKATYKIRKPTGRGMSFEDGLKNMVKVLTGMAGGLENAESGD